MTLRRGQLVDQFQLVQYVAPDLLLEIMRYLQNIQA